jgi:xanthine dehydrogenase YagR molybdenum-binding subunit
MVVVKYEKLRLVLKLEEARQEGAPPVFPGPADQQETAGGGGGVPQRGHV